MLLRLLFMVRRLLLVLSLLQQRHWRVVSWSWIIVEQYVCQHLICPTITCWMQVRSLNMNVLQACLLIQVQQLNIHLTKIMHVYIMMFREVLRLTGCLSRCVMLSLSHIVWVLMVVTTVQSITSVFVMEMMLVLWRALIVLVFRLTSVSLTILQVSSLYQTVRHFRLWQVTCHLMVISLIGLRWILMRIHIILTDSCVLHSIMTWRIHCMMLRWVVIVSQTTSTSLIRPAYSCGLVRRFVWMETLP